jgi:hypothetical protein
MKRSETMEQKLFRLVHRQWTTPLDALSQVGCLSLAQRVSEWRRTGHRIADKWVHLRSGKRVKAYKAG